MHQIRQVITCAQASSSSEQCYAPHICLYAACRETRLYPQHWCRDFSSLYESPAGASSEVLLLEGQDGNHLNPTQSRFSRFASGDTDSISAFGVTSRMFRNSSAAQGFTPAYTETLTQLRQPVGGPLQDEADMQTQSLSQSQTSQEHSHALSGQYSNQGLHYNSHHGLNTVSGDARMYVVHEGEAQTSVHSQQTSTHTSQRSTVMHTDGKTLLSPEQWRQPYSADERSPEASSSGYDDPNISGFARSAVSAESIQGVPQHHADMMHDAQKHDDPVEPSMQYSWSAQSQSYASSAGSPGRDSLHSWTGSTPAGPTAQQDPDSPDARTILRSIARDCQNAVAGRSPAPCISAFRLSPQSPGQPDLSRTPNSFFNPSFDADEESAK